MKKIIISLLLIILLVPTLAFAATRTSPVDLYKSVVGSDPEPGQRLFEQAEAAGKGEAFFQAMQDDRERYLNELVTEGVLTQEEADFMIDRMGEKTYADQQMMQQIMEKLRDAGEGYGRGGMMGQGQGFGGRGMRGNGGGFGCPMAPGN